MKKTLVLGNEYDDALRRALTDSLASMGAEFAARQWGLGGSQTLETTNVYVGKDKIVIQSDTYLGLSITGEARLVERLKALVAERMGTGN
ncbi:MAG TPA: hypothetical protein VHB79_07060 [Polyangiaceae bacterium]|nr:hypothetical protein [Polyangiaceae bacterium]